MLATDPKQRSSMAEIMNHPWMLKGYKTSPENYLPHREPLLLPLDPQVVHNMHGFGFGTPDEITEKLTSVLLSEDYRRAFQSSLQTVTFGTREMKDRKSLFSFHRRKILAHQDTPVKFADESVQIQDDSMDSFSPLISTYLLAKEKIEREKAEPKAENLFKPLTGKPSNETGHSVPSSFFHKGDEPNHKSEYSTLASLGCFSRLFMSLCMLGSVSSRGVRKHDASNSEKQVGSPVSPSTGGSEKSDL